MLKLCGWVVGFCVRGHAEGTPQTTNSPPASLFPRAPLVSLSSAPPFTSLFPAPSFVSFVSSHPLHPALDTPTCLLMHCA